MTTKTTLDQLCTTKKDALGSTKFVVESTITLLVSGDLPSTSIFVHQLGTVTDPKSDTFLRIGDIQDITNIVIGRNAAISTKAATYLSTGFTVEYNDVATATAAKQLIQAKIDQLIADWRTYNQAFISPVQSLYPLQDASVVAAKKAEYAATLKAKAAADAAALVAANALSAAQTEATDAADLLVIRQTASTDCATTRTSIDTIYAAETTFKAAASAFLNAVRGRPAPTLAATVDAALVAAQSEQTLLLAFASTFASALEDENSYVHTPLQGLSQTTLPPKCTSYAQAATSAAADKAAADAAISTTKRAALLAQQEALTAQTELESVLAELLEVCPSFEP